MEYSDFYIFENNNNASALHRSNTCHIVICGVQITWNVQAPWNKVYGHTYNMFTYCIIFISSAFSVTSNYLPGRVKWSDSYLSYKVCELLPYCPLIFGQDRAYFAIIP